MHARQRKDNQLSGLHKTDSVMSGLDRTADDTQKAGKHGMGDGFLDHVN